MRPLILMVSTAMVTWLGSAEQTPRVEAGSQSGGSLFEPLLFLDLNDTADRSGLLVPVAGTVSANASYQAPPLPYELGSLVVATIASQSQPGVFEVYAENTTGWEPLAQAPSGDPAAVATQGAGRYRTQGHHDCTLLRYTTVDFVHYSKPHVALSIPDCSGTPTMKSIARSPQGVYAMFTVGGGDGNSHTYTSHDAGMSWQIGATSGVAKPDKDDLNLIFNQGRFVDMQIVWQNHTLQYCDNGGCDRRRVISAKVSGDGINWGPDAPYITPDPVLDPPELQFYRMRPFYIGQTSRLAAHVLQYAPAPSQQILGEAYGRQPSMCVGKAGNMCHGPHMHEEWFIGPASGDAAETKGWRRPYRHTRAAPRDAFLMAPPVPFLSDQVLLWVGSGKIYTLPAYRIAGIFAPANGVFSTPEFTAPNEPIWVNADVSWYGKLNTTFDGKQGCDEGCAAYLFAEVLDAKTGKELPGYGVMNTKPIMAADGLKLRLEWEGKDRSIVDTVQLAGKRVRLRLHFRDATVYAVGAG